MKRLIICSVVWLIVCDGAFGQNRSSRARSSTRGGGKAKVEELSVYPSKATEKDSKYLLLPDPNNLSAADAAKLSDKAVQAMPKNSKQDEIRKWMKSPLDRLPVKRVEAALKPYQQALKLLDEAAKCKNCSWTSLAMGQMPKNHKGYRSLAYVLAVQARLQIVQGQYDDAVSTIRTGLTMSRNLGNSLTLIQGLIGTAIAAVMLEPTKDLIQMPDSPNLYSALGDLPSPLVDMNKALEAEMANIEEQPITARSELRKQKEPGHARIRVLMSKLNRSVAALQVIEAVRLYAGKNGKFPESLEQIKDFQLPQDPAMDQPFEYISSGSEASLKGLIPKGGDPRDAIEYKLKLRQKK
jgi:hypothetical protein